MLKSGHHGDVADVRGAKSHREEGAGFVFKEEGTWEASSRGRGMSRYAGKRGQL